MLPHRIFAAVGQQGLQGVQRSIEIAVADSAASIFALRHLLPTVENGVFKLRAKPQPAVVLPALRRARSRDQPFFGEKLGQIGEDGGQLGNHLPRVCNGGHFAHRVDGQIIRLFELRVIQRHGIVIRTAFGQHPAYIVAARRVHGIEGDFAHDVSLQHYIS